MKDHSGWMEWIIQYIKFIGKWRSGRGDYQWWDSKFHPEDLIVNGFIECEPIESLVQGENMRLHRKEMETRSRYGERENREAENIEAE